MKILKEYRLIILIVLILVAAIIFRTYNGSGFKYDALKRAESSIGGANIITVDMIAGLQGKKLIIDLGGSGQPSSDFSGKILKISPDSILDRQFLKSIRRFRGPVILCASDKPQLARVWMILSQTGIRDLYILNEKRDAGESLNKYRTDSLSGTEL